MWKHLCLLGSFVCGCGVASQPESSFRTALPSRQTLEVMAPDGGTTAQPQGSASTDTAQLYILTRQTTASVNGLVGGVLDTLGAVASTPPAAVSPNSAAWGPFSDALSPVVWRLTVTQLGPGQHAFLLAIGPKTGTDEDFQTFLQGASSGAETGPSGGTFSVDLGLAQQLDPVGNPNVGQIVAAWNVQAAGREVHVTLAGSMRRPSPRPQPTLAPYSFQMALELSPSMRTRTSWWEAMCSMWDVSAHTGWLLARAGPMPSCIKLTADGGPNSRSAGIRASTAFLRASRQVPAMAALKVTRRPASSRIL